VKGTQRRGRSRPPYKQRYRRPGMPRRIRTLRQLLASCCASSLAILVLLGATECLSVLAAPPRAEAAGWRVVKRIPWGDGPRQIGRNRLWFPNLMALGGGFLWYCDRDGKRLVRIDVDGGPDRAFSLDRPEIGAGWIAAGVAGTTDGPCLLVMNREEYEAWQKDPAHIVRHQVLAYDRDMRLTKRTNFGIPSKAAPELDWIAVTDDGSLFARSTDPVGEGETQALTCVEPSGKIAWYQQRKGDQADRYDAIVAAGNKLYLQQGALRIQGRPVQITIKVFSRHGVTKETHKLTGSWLAGVDGQGTMYVLGQGGGEDSSASGPVLVRRYSREGRLLDRISLPVGPSSAATSVLLADRRGVLYLVDGSNDDAMVVWRHGP